MKRQVITGGAIVVISVASAAAYGIVQSRWFGAAPPPRSVTRVEAPNTTSASSPKYDGAAQTSRGTPQASAAQRLPTESVPMSLPPPPVTFAQAPAPQSPLAVKPPGALPQSAAAPA